MFLLWKAFLSIQLLDLQGLQHMFLTQREYLLTLFLPTKGWGRNFFLSPILFYPPNVLLGHSFWSPVGLCGVPRHLTLVSPEWLSYITSRVLIHHISLVPCQPPILAWCPLRERNSCLQGLQWARPWAECFTHFSPFDPIYISVRKCITGNQCQPARRLSESKKGWTSGLQARLVGPDTAGIRDPNYARRESAQSLFCLFLCRLMKRGMWPMTTPQPATIFSVPIQNKTGHCREGFWLAWL